ncbi:MAG: S8 family serine peptidase [Bryobacteraceae bacterium]|nr:S8 family serine peptidase [Bryobacteraceae bacterium]
MRRGLAVAALAWFASAAPAWAQREERWAAFLNSPPEVERSDKSPAARTAAFAERSAVRAALAERKLPVLGSSELLVNAVYFAGTREDAEAVRGLPGVSGVVRLKVYKKHADDRATEIVRAPQAWTALGGIDNAGTGVRIGIIDSGVDVTHPAFADPSLTAPSGFPRVTNESDRQFTSGKVIVARSYVTLLSSTNPEFSSPDDFSARDRDGHGTAVAMLAAGRRVTGPGATVVGVAPKAYIGSYKVFGSPGLNEATFSNVLVAALEDAVRDGMDVVTLSLGSPAEFGALDMCNQNRNPCDPFAMAVNNAVTQSNLSVVVSAGNSGDVGFNLPTLGSIDSPGTAPAAVTVGAIYNGQIYYETLRIGGPNVPTNLREIDTRFGDGPLPKEPLTAPLRDARSTGDDGKACRPLGNNALTGAIALIDRGDCNRDVKVNHAQRAGAVGVIFVNFDGDNFVFPPNGLDGTGIPAILIGASTGAAIRTHLGQNPTATATLDPAIRAVTAATDEIAYLSAQGPAIGDLSVKPELTAVGTDLYVATQDYDPNSSLYSASRYRSVQGTSFSVPMVAGAIALVKQRNRNWTPAQLKSAVTTSANPNIDDLNNNDGRRNRARVAATGAGKLDAAQALNVTITASPAAVSFGVVTGPPVAREVLITNTTNAAVTLNAQVQQRDTDTSARVTVTPAAFQMSPGQTTRITLRVEGSRPAAGSYEGVVNITGSGAALRIPYLYLLGDNVPYNIYPLAGNGFIGVPNQGLNNQATQPRLSVKVLDKSGVPVANQAVRWSVLAGGGRIEFVSTDSRTDTYGISEAFVSLGSALGEQAFRVEAGSLSQVFEGRTIVQPAIRSDGIQDAASFRTGIALAPGSYMTIKGSGLSEVPRVYSTNYLPVALSNVSVSFDEPNRRLQAPGHLHFVSEGQVNVQIPWEFSNQTVARVKVWNGLIQSGLVDVPLTEFAPGIFEYDDPDSGRKLAAALDENFALVRGSNPVRRGRTLSLFCNGLGRVSNQPASGQPAPASPLSETLTKPSVTIGGRPASVSFSGLAPGFVGLYQVNVTVPDDAPTGVQPVALSVGGATSQTSQVPVN